MNSVVQDVRFSLRLIRKHPATSFLVVAALVLGIGANSAMFSVVNAVLLRPLPLSDPDRLVLVRAKSQQSLLLVSYPDFQDWKNQSRSFQSLAAALSMRLNLSGNAHPERLLGVAVTASFFKTLGVTPTMGRDFTSEDERPGAARVAVLSHGFWQRRFGGDPAILGRTIKLNDEVYSIVGVLPPNPYVWFQTWDVWVGIGPFLNQHMMSRETRFLIVVGRLARHISLVQTEAEIDTIADRLAAQYPATNKNLGASVTTLNDWIASISKPLWPIVLATAAILLLACVNVVTVFISSAIQRRKELSVRLALGASRSVLWRQLFLQGLIFATIGASLGMVVAKLGLAYFIKSFPDAAGPRFPETAIDQTVFWFTVCMTVGCTLFSSILPGFYIARLNISTELKGDWTGKRISKFRLAGQTTLIVFEVALAAGLSVVSGLLIKSFYELGKVDLGFNSHQITSFEITLPETRYKDEQAKVNFYQRAIENLRAIPGVQSASASHMLPAATSTQFINLQVDGQSPFAAERPFVDSNAVLPGFFATMKIPIMAGREFADSDRAGAPPVAIVDSVLAAHIWPGQSAIGKHLRLADLTDNGPPWREIIGVVRQIKYSGPESKVERPQVYEPVYQHPPSRICFVIEAGTSAATLRAPVEKTINDIVPDLPLDRFRMLDDFLDRIESGRKVSLLLLSGFAGVGIILGMIGIYGVVSNSVVRRRRELAIRMALGAGPRSSILLVTKLGLQAAFVGIALGSILVMSLAKIISTFLFGVAAFDTGIYLFSAIAIAMLALLASLFPAARVLRVNPQDVLRGE